MSALAPNCGALPQILCFARVANGLCTSAQDGNVYALNASTGASWSFTTGGNEFLAQANGVVYVGSTDHNVYALNAAPATVELQHRRLL